MLHEIHNGAFGDHVVTGPALHVRLARKLTCASMRWPTSDFTTFLKGITLTSQWTGTEHKNMEKVYLGALANATEPRVQLAVRGVLDFTYYAHSKPTATNHLEIREHFNITRSINSNTISTPSVLVVGYKATNKKAYTQQMTVWLRRQEAVHKFGSYLQWAVPGTLLNLPVMSSENRGESVEPPVEPDFQVPDDSDDDEGSGCPQAARP
ncbi:hypothetical protein B0H10DRAFT_2243414 [Mycena sp. CBHHK59/15]|nr:hypothetical protein B0H10DRAFT_2243414 [Mycena sp. CBHHK59/15]